MQEGRELVAVLDEKLDRRLVERVVSAMRGASAEERLAAAVEAVVVSAELDPEGTSAALAALRADPRALQRLESGLALPTPRATLALGGAIQLARTELASRNPDLRARAPELLRWLEGAW